jgi:uncharacterized protein (TIGR00369 family)
VQERDLIAMPGGLEPVVAPETSFDALYGLEIVSGDVDGEGVVRGRVVVRPELLSGHGAVHGGVFASIAEALASRGTWVAVAGDGFAAMGLSNDTNLLEPVREGAIEVEAQVLDRGAGAWLWTVDARDESGRLAAHSRVTVAVRPLRT